MERTLYVWQKPGPMFAYSNDVSAVLPVVSCRRLLTLRVQNALPPNASPPARTFRPEPAVHWLLADPQPVFELLNAASGPYHWAMPATHFPDLLPKTLSLLGGGLIPT